MLAVLLLRVPRVLPGFCWARTRRLDLAGVARYGVTRDGKVCTMRAASERMKALRASRRALGLREIRLWVPDAHNPEFRQRIAEEVARLNPEDGQEAMRWIEDVSRPHEKVRSR
jgi:hypothetical protein